MRRCAWWRRRLSWARATKDRGRSAPAHQDPAEQRRERQVGSFTQHRLRGPLRRGLCDIRRQSDPPAVGRDLHRLRRCRVRPVLQPDRDATSDIRLHALPREPPCEHAPGAAGLAGVLAATGAAADRSPRAEHRAAGCSAACPVARRWATGPRSRFHCRHGAARSAAAPTTGVQDAADTARRCPHAQHVPTRRAGRHVGQPVQPRAVRDRQARVSGPSLEES